MLNYISSFGVIIPLAIGLWYWRTLSLPARIIVGYFGFWTVEAVADRLSRTFLHTNMYLYHVSVLVETWLLGWAYYHVYDAKPVRKAMLPVGLLFTLVAVADATVISGLHSLNAVARAVQVALMLAMILIYFEQWMREIRPESPWHNFMFIVSVGLAVYYAGSVMSYLLHPANGTLASAIMSVIIDGSYIINLVLMTLGLWRETRQQSSTNYDSNIFA
ncbi:hypothetical protein [Hymenobacter edaphi]|uniref:Uncharacterized protein n=1 Tax=Hymenobacter edaphi TaxID=2211146 RepID=A0A328BGZ9_9BACT|nr:hypothetical protein [Hymenobacter edaphi]RAK65915.1 hypothetical protein DLM85_14490 [Hymenobacter edaphi]